MQPNQIKPTLNFLLIELVREDTSIVMPGNAQAPDAQAVIRAMGPQVTGMAVGDSVLFRHGTALQPIAPNSPNFGMVDASLVMAIVNPTIAVLC